MENLKIGWRHSKTGAEKQDTIENVTSIEEKGKGDYHELWVYVEGELDTIYGYGEIIERI